MEKYYIIIFLFIFLLIFYYYKNKEYFCDIKEKRKNEIILKYNMMKFEKIKKYDLKCAVLIFGLHYKNNYQNWYFGKTNINYKYYINNIKNLFCCFSHVDYFLSTNKSEKTNELIKDYNAKEYNFNDLPRWEKILIGLKIIEKNKNNYDMIAITRFDIFFIMNLNNIDINKLNIISILEAKHLICDNFYLFPTKYLNNFIEIFENIKKYSNHNSLTHGLKNEFEKRFDLNYIKNENKKVQHLSSYQLHVF